jgi:hypothetical protein
MPKLFEISQIDSSSTNTEKGDEVGFPYIPRREYQHAFLLFDNELERSLDVSLYVSISYTISNGYGTEIESQEPETPQSLSNFIPEDTMFDLSDPHSWTYFTNWFLVAVALIAAGYIGFGILREKRARRLHARPQHDPHTLILSDLGITMADGGEKVVEPKSKNGNTPA